MFKYILYMLLMLFTTASGESYSKENISVCVEIEGFKNDKGLCYLLLFKSEKGFPESSKHAAIILKKRLIDGTAKFEFNVNPGVYAISVLHDESLNEKLDKTWYGKPVEGFGISNNPKIGFGPPGFQKSSIVLEDKNNFLKIKMNYL